MTTTKSGAETNVAICLRSLREGVDVDKGVLGIGAMPSGAKP